MVKLPSLAPAQKTLVATGRALTPAYKKFRTLPRLVQVVVAVVATIALLFGIGSLTKLFGPKDDSTTQLPTVTLAPVAELSGGSSSVGVIGTVRSITEANILAQSGGTVTSVRASLGSSVPAGFVLATLENASQVASVLQAEGAYDAAVAARTGASPVDISASGRNTYATAYSSLDTTLKTYIDTFYGYPGGNSPKFLIETTPYDFSYFSVKRATLMQTMNTWRLHTLTADSADPQVLLTEADTVLHLATALSNDMAVTATRPNTDASAAQLAALATGRASIASIQATVTSAKQANQSQGTSATAGANASVKSALGALRAAQANLEKTLVRAPISGTVNFLPIRVGDYVTPLSRVATVAQNGALEIVTYVTEENRALLTVGSKVKVEEKYDATVTSISPALDPVTKQIEVHLAVVGTNALVNGQSVHVSFLSVASSPASQTTGPLLLPLTALKLTPSARVVFSIGTDGKLIAHPVELGDVRGDQIEVKTALPGDLRIVTDARGLSDGQKVQVVTVP